MNYHCYDLIAKVFLHCQFYQKQFIHYEYFSVKKKTLICILTFWESN